MIISSIPKREPIMHITTTFWSEKVETLHTIFYFNPKSKEIVAQADSHNPFELALFFKKISQLVKTNKFLKSQNNNDNHYQFGTMIDNQMTPIVWFDIHLNDSTIVSHDHAFNTCMVKINNHIKPFGRFPIGSFWDNKPKDFKLPIYREFKIKSRVFKFISNKIMKNI